MEAGRDMFAFLDGAVSVERNLGILQHLNVCASCARRFEAEKRFEEGTARALRDEPVPAGLRAGLVAALDRADRERAAGAPPAAFPAPPSLLRPRLLRGRFGLAAAAAAVLVVAVLAADYVCLGPFQCPVILAAAEVAAAAEAGGGPARGPLPGAPDLSAAGLRNVCHAEGVCVPALDGLEGCVLVYEGPPGTAWLVCLPTGDHQPKRWNRVVEDGRAWYEARVGDRRVRGWCDEPGFRAMVTRSEGVDLAALSRLARGGR